MTPGELEERRRDAIDAMPLSGKIARWADIWLLPLAVGAGLLCAAALGLYFLLLWWS